MAYGLPTRGQADWDDELNNSMEALRGDVQSAVANASSAKSTAISAQVSADAAAASAAQSATAAETAASAATAPTDETMAAKVNDSTSQTHAALSATYARVVAATTLTGAGIEAAASQAGVGGTVRLLPNETYDIATPITLDRVSLEGDGSPVLSVATSLGSGVPALTITAPTEGHDNLVRLNGFTLVGPGARTLGAKTADCDGIKVTGYSKPHFSDLRVRQFDSGLVYANTVGHIYCDRVLSTDNYYGVYLSVNNSDYLFNECLINGNTFANFGCPADQGWSSLVVSNSHIGYAPYSFYQEATPAAQGSNRGFIQEAMFRGARFEAIGNAAIWSDATQDATNYSVSGNIIIENPGFSWATADGTYNIAGRDRTHAILLGQTTRIIYIWTGAYRFTSGDGGTSSAIRVKRANHDAIELRGSNTASTDVTADAGNARAYAYAAPVVNGASPSFAMMDLTADSGYVRWSGNDTRLGGDASLLYADSKAGFRWRDSDAGYVTRMRLTDTGLVVPRVYPASGDATTGPFYSSGTGSPEGVLTAPVGSLYSRTDGGAGTTLYVKESGTGNTGWVAK